MEIGCGKFGGKCGFSTDCDVDLQEEEWESGVGVERGQSIPLFYLLRNSPVALLDLSPRSIIGNCLTNYPTALLDLLHNPRVRLYPPPTSSPPPDYSPHRNRLLLPPDSGFLPRLLHPELDLA